MAPLDSRTRTGRVVDRIITILSQEVEGVKSNLYDIEEWPTLRTNEENRQALLSWKIRVQLQPSDIVVTLGHFVNEVFRKTKTPSIRVGHPASVRSRVKKEIYIVKLVSMIRTTIEYSDLPANQYAIEMEVSNG
jgi:hypothetical protein